MVCLYNNTKQVVLQVSFTTAKLFHLTC